MGIPRNVHQPVEPHWNFAVAAVLGRLEFLAWGFDSMNAQIDASGHSYIGVPEPFELMAIIDHFLAEDGLFYQGDIKNLRDMRQYLEKNIAPLFEAGREAARRYWENIPHPQQADLTTSQIEEFRAEAKAQAPAEANPSQKAWFVEASVKAGETRNCAMLLNLSARNGLFRLHAFPKV